MVLLWYFFSRVPVGFCKKNIEKLEKKLENPKNPYVKNPSSAFWTPGRAAGLNGLVYEVRAPLRVETGGGAAASGSAEGPKTDPKRTGPERNLRKNTVKTTQRKKHKPLNKKHSKPMVDSSPRQLAA